MRLQESDGLSVSEFLQAQVDVVEASRHLWRLHATSQPGLAGIGGGLDQRLLPLVSELLSRAVTSGLGEGLSKILGDLATLVGAPQPPDKQIQIFRIEIARPTPQELEILPGGFPLVLKANDALCDILVQPVRIFIRTLMSMASLWIRLPEIPDFQASQAPYRTRQASPIRARWEALLREAVGFSPHRAEVGLAMNVP